MTEEPRKGLAPVTWSSWGRVSLGRPPQTAFPVHSPADLVPSRYVPFHPLPVDAQPHCASLLPGE